MQTMRQKFLCFIGQHHGSSTRQVKTDRYILQHHCCNRMEVTSNAPAARKR